MGHNRRLVHSLLSLGARSLPAQANSVIVRGFTRSSSGNYDDNHVGAGRKMRVVIGMSGGVDSTVAAYLLKKQGHDVIGVFMKNWDTLEEMGKECVAEEAARDAKKICQHLDIPFERADFIKEYWTDVFTPMIESYQAGNTPNPDVDCNSKIKFGHFFKFCEKNFDVDAIATGHYARVIHEENESFMLQAIDRVKDQTIFLSQISHESLRKTLFPLGNYTKDVVKKIAKSIGLGWVAEKKESMGLCFIGKRDCGFQDFINEYIAPSKGEFVDIDTGKAIGEHEGVHKWTVGQGCRIGGLSKRYYVVEKNIKNQQITVCAGKYHPSLFSDTYFTYPPRWISPFGAPKELNNIRERMLECHQRSQNVQPITKCALTLRMTSSTNWEYIDQDNGLSVSLGTPERAITEGQYAAFYLNEVCLGSAKIERVGPSLYTMNSKNCRTEILDKIKAEQESGRFKY